MFSFYEYSVFCAGWPLLQNGPKRTSFISRGLLTKSKANNENEESDYCGEITWVWEFQDFLFVVHTSLRKKAALFEKKVKHIYIIHLTMVNFIANTLNGL